MNGKIIRAFGFVLISSPAWVSLLFPFVYWILYGVADNGWVDAMGFMSTVSIVILLGIWLTSYKSKETK